MASFPQEVFNQKANAAGITQRGFRPELFTVANGTYASNAVYGSGTAATSTYINNQLQRGTTTIPLTGTSFVTSTEGCDIRQQDRDVDFTCSVVLDGTTDPDFSTQELRIRPYVANPIVPPSHRIPLPLPMKDLPLPLFHDVEIVNKAGVQIAPDATAGQGGVFSLLARLLEDGQLALVVENTVDQPSTSRGLRHDDIDAGFVADNIIRITVRGTYKAEVSLNRGNLPGPSIYNN
jgi:hypothetical protein